MSVAYKKREFTKSIKCYSAANFNLLEPVRPWREGDGVDYTSNPIFGKTPTENKIMQTKYPRDPSQRINLNKNKESNSQKENAQCIV